MQLPFYESARHANMHLGRLKSCQSLSNNKMADQNNSTSTANLNYPAEPDAENLGSSFSPFLE